LPQWAIEEVTKLEPDRWPLLVEAYLRWDGCRLAIDPGKAFVGWAKKMLGISKAAKPGERRGMTAADWPMLEKMAGMTLRDLAGLTVTPEMLAGRRRHDWRAQARQMAAPSRAAPTAKVRLPYGDPRCEAWMSYLEQQQGAGHGTHWNRQQRGELMQDADWPPLSPEVAEQVAAGQPILTIRAHTPEWWAHLAAMRRSGLADKAQDATLSGRDLLEQTPWPKPAEAGKAAA
jgi:hypothetical protein